MCAGRGADVPVAAFVALFTPPVAVSTPLLAAPVAVEVVLFTADVAAPGKTLESVI